MLDKPRIVQTAAQLTALIRLTIPRVEIQNVMGPGIAELMAAIAAQGTAPAGPIFSHHLRKGWMPTCLISRSACLSEHRSPPRAA